MRADPANRVIAGLDSKLRRALGEIVAGFALINFGVVVAILTLQIGSSPDRTAAAVGAFVAALLGVTLAAAGANELRE